MFQYTLDGDLDFHNSAEPSTTSCPLMPGQLVNVLHVPFNFTSGRPRNASTSSAVSEIRTMNPYDKYVNPRPVPQLPRLNTSPTVASFLGVPASTSATATPWSAQPVGSNRDFTPPASSTSLKLFKLPRKRSSRSTSPGRERVPTSIKAALRNMMGNRADSPDSDSGRGRSEEVTPVGEISGPLIPHRSSDSRSPRPFTRRRESPGYRQGSASSDSVPSRDHFEQSSGPSHLLKSGKLSSHRSRSPSRDSLPFRRLQQESQWNDPDFPVEVKGPLTSQGNLNSKVHQTFSGRGESPGYRQRSASKDSLPFRRPLEQQPDRDDSYTAMSSFRQHRRQKSNSRDPSPLRKSLIMDDNQSLSDAVRELPRAKNWGLEAVEEVNTPQWPLTGKKSIKEPKLQLGPDQILPPNPIGSPLGSAGPDGEPLVYGGSVRVSIQEETGTNKRLPTLPNTPSSAYPVSDIDESPMKLPVTYPVGMDQSHFSTTTFDTDTDCLVSDTPLQSHFSAWTSTTDNSSRILSEACARVTSGLTDFEMSPTFSQASELIPDSPQTPQHLHSEESQAEALPSVRSLANLMPGTSAMSHNSMATTIDDSSPIAHHFQGLGLGWEEPLSDPVPRSVLPTPSNTEHKQTYQLPSLSEAAKMAGQADSANDSANDEPTSAIYRPRSDSRDWQKQRSLEDQNEMILQHNESIRQLMEEIGYLRDMIAGTRDST